MWRPRNLLAPVLLSLAHAVLQLDLSTASGARWNLSNANRSLLLPATVPGTATLALLTAGVVAEPVSGNTDDTRWVAEEESWTWTCLFISPVSSKGYAELVLDGIDTVATVTVNGRVLLSTQSAFRRYVVQVDQDLFPPTYAAENVLQIKILSSTTWATQSFAICTGWCPEFKHDGNATSGWSGWNYVRKPPVHFGWDFALPAADARVGSVFVRWYEAVALEDVVVTTVPVRAPVPRNGTSPWSATFSVHARTLDNDTEVNATVAVVAYPGGEFLGSARATATFQNYGDNVINVTLQADAAAWWPTGLGDPTLYNASVTLWSGTDASIQSFLFGFRTTELLFPPSPDGVGTLYQLHVNGLPFFAKGSNWVPHDPFMPRAGGEAQLGPKLDSMVAAHYNTLRVWGGGQPMPDIFYELAARKGLLLWHELPFACAGYPSGSDFLQTVAQETVDIVRRVSKGPILLWSGNNEVAQNQNYPPAPSVQAGNYSLVFFGAVRDPLRTVDSARPFIATSPGSGVETPESPVASPVESPSSGDMHVYNYTGDCWDPASYPRARAVTEFGWQSYPSLIGIAEVLDAPFFDYWVMSTRRVTHNAQPPTTILFKNVGENWRLPDGKGAHPDARNYRLGPGPLAAATAARASNATSTVLVPRSDGTFTLPTDATGWAGLLQGRGGPGLANGTVLRDTLLLTQLSQAYCVKVETEKYRRLQSECGQGDGGGCTAIALYWMSADSWPAATKGSLEWSGRWKSLHYTASKFFAPFLVSPWTLPSEPVPPFGVYASAHPPAALPVEDGVLVVTCWAWASGRLGETVTPWAVQSWDSPGGGVGNGGSVNLLPAGATLQGTLDGCGCGAPRTPAQCVLTVDAYASKSRSPASLLGSNHLYVAPLNTVTDMRDPQLTIVDVVASGVEGGFVVTLTAASLPVAEVWIESLLCCGSWSDNGWLMTASPAVLVYTPRPDARGWAHPGADGNVTVGQFAASLSVWSLVDTAGGYSGVV